MSKHSELVVDGYKAITYAEIKTAYRNNNIEQAGMVIQKAPGGQGWVLEVALRSEQYQRRMACDDRTCIRVFETIDLIIEQLLNTGCCVGVKVIAGPDRDKVFVD